MVFKLWWHENIYFWSICSPSSSNETELRELPLWCEWNRTTAHLPVPAPSSEYCHFPESSWLLDTSVSCALHCWAEAFPPGGEKPSLPSREGSWATHLWLFQGLSPLPSLSGTLSKHSLRTQVWMGPGGVGGRVQSELHTPQALHLGRVHMSLDLSYMMISLCFSRRQCGLMVMGWALEEVLVQKFDSSPW